MGVFVHNQVHQLPKDAESKNADRIPIDEIRSALKYSRKYRLSYLLGKLNEHQRIVYAILNEKGSTASGELFDEYCRRAKEPVVDRVNRKHMEMMVELGLKKTVQHEATVRGQD